MFPISNDSSRITSTNTVKTSITCVVVLACDTRKEVRSVRPKLTTLATPIVAEDLQVNRGALLGTMKFNDAQTAYCKQHTRPEVSKKMQKLVMLRTIAHDQEKAGLHFEGRRSFAEAEVNLLEEKLTQASQAARTQNPLSYFRNTIKGWVSGFSYYFEAEPTIENLFTQFSSPIGDSTYKVRKSAALLASEAAGETISNIGVGLIDSHHDYISVQKGIEAFLEKHFNSARGDIFLAEAVFLFEEIDGKERVVIPSLEKHHALFCLGIPLQSCKFLKEPEKEVGELSVALSYRRNLVNQIFDYLMNAIPQSKALEARQKLAKHNQEIFTIDTEIKVRLVIDYKSYCRSAKIEKFASMVKTSTAATNKEKEAHAATNAARDQAYLSQIKQAMDDLTPGAKLYYLQGIDHFSRLSPQLNRLNTFFIEPAITAEKEEL